MLCHAIADALLGAAGERDIGYHFPDSDEKYKGISSLVLLGYVKDILSRRGATVSNIDATVVMQRPKIAALIPEMKKNIASALGIPEDDVNIKATTEEGLGFTGRGEGIAAHAVCIICL